MQFFTHFVSVLGPSEVHATNQEVDRHWTLPGPCPYGASTLSLPTVTVPHGIYNALFVKVYLLYCVPSHVLKQQMTVSESVEECTAVAHLLA
jgi:hypothetical protein